ncbi:hypothetical protein CGCSCA4_v009663 [Colletotrichum siamense]|uniref:Uncharacterized protein n=1 Tax=Colletotrichum siamense TaxID=690259 RepID=A0A9P5F3P2_COLSI|nr:hypothetical protein CGCSCA4_v009663 [Colletotrichum siamense]KAF4865325.1 hypothetical protein CGCSCA2_v001338 [Colletotrichum siamense]
MYRCLSAQRSTSHDSAVPLGSPYLLQHYRLQHELDINPFYGIHERLFDQHGSLTPMSNSSVYPDVLSSEYPSQSVRWHSLPDHPVNFTLKLEINPDQHLGCPLRCRSTGRPTEVTEIDGRQCRLKPVSRDTCITNSTATSKRKIDPSHHHAVRINNLL